MPGDRRTPVIGGDRARLPPSHEQTSAEAFPCVRLGTLEQPEWAASDATTGTCP